MEKVDMQQLNRSIDLVGLVLIVFALYGCSSASGGGNTLPEADASIEDLGDSGTTSAPQTDTSMEDLGDSGETSAPRTDASIEDSGDSSTTSVPQTDAETDSSMQDAAGQDAETSDGGTRPSDCATTCSDHGRCVTVDGAPTCACDSG